MVTLQDPGLDAALLGTGLTPMLDELEALAQRYAGERTRAELGQPWRPGFSKLHKLMASLEAWLGYCPAKQRRQFLQRLQPVVQAAWGLHDSVQVGGVEVSTVQECVGWICDSTHISVGVTPTPAMPVCLSCMWCAPRSSGPCRQVYSSEVAAGLDAA